MSLLLLLACASNPTGPLPMAQSADLVARPVLPDPPAARVCEGSSKPYEVSGVVTWADGSPAEGVTVALVSAGERAADVRTDATGTYLLAADRAGLISVVDAVAARSDVCVRPPLIPGPAREDFVVARTCPVNVRALGAGTNPVPDAVVRWEVRQGAATFRGAAAGTTDGRGELLLGALPCGEVSLQVVRTGLAQGRGEAGIPSAMRAPCRAGDVDSVRTCFRTAPGRGETPTVAVELTKAVALRGRVTQMGGAPVAGARAAVLLVGDTYTNADGRWELWVPPGALREKRFLSVRSPSHLDTTVEIEAPEADAEWSSEVELVPTRRIAARCAGLPDDRCTSLVVSCGFEGDKTVHECLDRDPDICECPTSRDRVTVLGGGGVAVYVDPGATSAWLDFRPLSGSVSGRVDAALCAGCTVRLDRPAELRATMKGPGQSRAVAVGADGSFAVDHVATGAWELRVVPRGTLTVGEAPALRTIEVGEAALDVGELAAAAVAQDE